MSQCLSPHRYALYLSRVLSALQPAGEGSKSMTELSLVYYNNLLSLPPIALLALVSGEFPKVCVVVVVVLSFALVNVYARSRLPYMHSHDAQSWRHTHTLTCAHTGAVRPRVP